MEEFQTVKYKRQNRNKNKPPLLLVPNTPNIVLDKDILIKGILDAKLCIAEADIFQSILASLKEGIHNLELQTITQIVCFGIGKISESFVSRYQFALLLCLKDLYKVDVQVYEPMFNETDISLLNNFEVSLLDTNLEAKYKVNKKTVLFYLPHCPKQLSNNLLWANWGLNLEYCIIIANSFNTIIEQSSSQTLKVSAEYITRIYPHTLELPIINSFKYYQIFNDTAIHFFPKLNMLPQDLWDQCDEPVYLEDIEYAPNKS